MNRMLLMSIFFFIIEKSSIAQQINYDSTGRRTKVQTEQAKIVIQKVDDDGTRSASGGISLPTVLGNTIGFTVDILKTAIAKQQEKYTASYTATVSEKDLLYLRNPKNQSTIDLNIANIIFYRITNHGQTIDTCLILELTPKVEPNSGIFRLQIIYCKMPYSKAKIKRWGKYGKTVDLSIDVKIDALWQESTAKDDTSRNSNQIPSSYTIKTSTLGESTIMLPSMKPSRSPCISQKDSLYTGWFQLPPQAASRFANSDDNSRVGFYNISLTVKEANPYALNSKDLSDFLSGSASDLGTLLKGLIPQQTNSSK